MFQSKAENKRDNHFPIRLFEVLTITRSYSCNKLHGNSHPVYDITAAKTTRISSSWSIQRVLRLFRSVNTLTEIRVYIFKKSHILFSELVYINLVKSLGDFGMRRTCFHVSDHTINRSPLNTVSRHFNQPRTNNLS